MHFYSGPVATYFSGVIKQIYDNGTIAVKEVFDNIDLPLRKICFIGDSNERLQVTITAICEDYSHGVIGDMLGDVVENIIAYKEAYLLAAATGLAIGTVGLMFKKYNANNAVPLQQPLAARVREKGPDTTLQARSIKCGR